jgi:hypothetical protein
MDTLKPDEEIVKVRMNIIDMIHTLLMTGGMMVLLILTAYLTNILIDLFESYWKHF